MLALDRLLVPTDFSACADQALRHAKRLARSYEAELHLLHVIPVAAAHPMLGVQATPSERTDRVMEQFDEVVETLNLDDLSYELAIEHGEGVASTVLEYAENHALDLIVVGTHGRRGVQRLMLGSETEEILRRADRPVLTVGQGDNGKSGFPPERLLVPVDLSVHSRDALRHAAAVAQYFEVRLDLIHVIESVATYDPAGPYQAVLPSEENALPTVKKNIRDTLHDLAEELPLPTENVRVYVGQSPAVPFIVDVATEEDIDLLVLSSHGRSGLERFLIGSVAEKVIRTAPCPVFVVKAYGHTLLDEAGTPEEE